VAVSTILSVLAQTTVAQSTGFLCAARDVLDRYQELTEANGVVLQGDLAFVADGPRGLVILDVSEPNNIRFVGEVDTPGDAKRVVVTESVALVADSIGGLQVIDISNPTSPAIVGAVTTPGTAVDLVEIDGLVYVADIVGLSIVDISNPAAPVVRGSFATPGDAAHLSVSENIAYVVDGAPGLQVVDVSEPTNPLLLTTLEINGTLGIAVSGDRGYLTHSYAFLTVLDLTNPAQPQIVETFDLPFRPSTDLTLSEDRLFMDGLNAVYDLTDPDNPTYLGAGLAPGRQVATLGSLALVVLDNTLVSVAIHDIRPSGVLGRLSAQGVVEGLAIQDAYVYSAEYEYGMHVIDVSDSAAPIRIASIDTGGFTHDIVIQDDYLYVMDDASGLRVIDVSNPTIPAIVNEPNTLQGQRIAVAGNTAAVLSTVVRFVDISEPTSPLVLAAHTVGGGGGRYHNEVRLAAGYAYVSTTSRLYIFDLAHPTAEPLAILDGSRSAIAVDPNRGIACLATDDGIVVIDISEPTNPLQIGQIEIEPGNQPVSIEIVGRRALASLERYGNAWLIDLEDPSNPELVTSANGWFNTSLGAWDIEVSDNTAYFGTPVDGLVILDLSDCPCPADFNNDNTTDTRDVIAFLAAWAAQRGGDCSDNDCTADITGDGLVDSRDVVAFLNLWNTGC
jgi:hypothetical protein